MRVLVLVARDPENPKVGGGEITFSEWSKVLVRRGHEVDYLCSTFPGGSRRADMAGVRVVRVGPEGTLGVAAFREYFRHYRHSVDVVLEDMLGGNKIPFAAPLYVSQPVVTVWHQDHMPLFSRQYPAFMLPLLGGLERGLVFLHRNCSVLTPSQESKDSYSRKGGAANNVRIYHPGLPESSLGGGPNPPASERRRQVLFLGKLRRYKRPDLAIEAFSIIKSSVPDATMVIAGRPDDPDYLRELKHLVALRNLDGSVSFEIGVHEERKVELLKSSRVLLSTATVEGYSIAILEASAAGLPTVATAGIPREALRDGETGFRIPGGDVSSLARLSVPLLTDAALFDRISRNCVEVASGNTWEKATEPLLTILDALRSR
jgi:glycosyltransferase involved in cell wall biosynthesis